MDPIERPSFLTAYFEALAASARKRGLMAIFPYRLLVCAAVGGAVAYALPIEFWSDDRWDTSTAVFAGLLTFNALIIAVTWSAFSKVFEIITSGQFGAYLKSCNLLHRYLVSIGYINIAQGAAALASAAALLLVPMTFSHPLADRIVAGICVGLTAYALLQATEANRLMADLVWNKAIFDEGRPGGHNVVRMGDR